MVKKVSIPFVGESKESRSGFVSSELTRNMYLEKKPDGTFVLFCTPGLKPLMTAGSGPIRSNGVLFNNKSYVISGSQLIEIDELFNETIVGTLTGTVSSYVSMVAGHNYLTIVDGDKGYYYGPIPGTPAFGTITDPDFPKASFVEWIDGYFIVNDIDTGIFFICQNVDDPTAWSALDFTEAQLKGDNLIRPIWLQKSLLLIGEYTSELYYNSGNPDFPFEAQPNAIYEYGGISGAACVSTVGGVYMLARAQDGGVKVIFIGSQTPTIISTPEIDWQLQQATFAELQQSTAYVFRWGGHTFYSLSVPSLDRTFLYDETTGTWGEWGGLGRTIHRGIGHVYYNGKNLIGDRETNQIYELSGTTFTDNGLPIERVRRGQIISKDNRRMFMRSLTVLLEPGVGLTTGQGNDPQIMLRWSDTGGKLWSNELTASMGKIGEYYNQVTFYRLGQFRERIIEIRVTDPVNVVIRGMTAEIEVADA